MLPRPRVGRYEIHLLREEIRYHLIVVLDGSTTQDKSQGITRELLHNNLGCYQTTWTSPWWHALWKWMSPQDLNFKIIHIFGVVFQIGVYRRPQRLSKMRTSRKLHTWKTRTDDVDRGILFCVYCKWISLESLMTGEVNAFMLIYCCWTSVYIAAIYTVDYAWLWQLNSLFLHLFPLLTDHSVLLDCGFAIGINI